MCTHLTTSRLGHPRTPAPAIDPHLPLSDAFRVADDVVRHGVRGISDIITVPGLVNVDFADVSAVMRGAGHSLMGMGRASGRDRAQQAALAATRSPLLEVRRALSMELGWGLKAALSPRACTHSWDNPASPAARTAHTTLLAIAAVPARSASTRRRGLCTTSLAHLT